MAALGLEVRRGPCLVCRSDLERFSTVLFNGEAGWSREVNDIDDDLPEFVQDVSEHLAGIAARARERAATIIRVVQRYAQDDCGPRIIATLTELRGGIPAEWCSYEEIASLLIVEGRDELTRALTEVHAAAVAVDSMNMNDDTPALLDETVPWWGFDEAGRSRLAPARPYDIPLVWTGTLDLIASWAADRHGTRLPLEQRQRYSHAAVAWVDGHPDAVDGLGTASFLQRTVEIDTIERALLAIYLDNAVDGERVARVWFSWHVIEAGDFKTWISKLLPVDQTEASHTIGLEPSIPLDVRLATLTAAGRDDELVREFVNGLRTVGLDEGARSAVVAIEAFEQRGDYSSAADQFGEFLEVFPEDSWETMSPPDLFMLLNTVGNLGRRISGLDAALTQYQRAWLLSAAPGITSAHRWTLISNMAQCLTELGRTRAASSLLLGLLQNEQLSEWEINRSLGELGALDLSLGDYESARDLLTSVWRRVENESDESFGRLDLLVNLTLAYEAVGDMEQQLKFALLANDLAQSRGRLTHQLWSLTSAVVAANSLDHPSGPQLAGLLTELSQHARVLLDSPRLEEIQAGGVRQQVIGAESTLAAIRHDTAEFLRLLEMTEDPSPQALTTSALLQLEDGELDGAASAIERAWIAELAAGFQDPDIQATDTQAFRGTRNLRTVTTRHALRQFERSPESRPLLRASELDGSLLGSYLAWPESARPSEADMLRIEDALQHPDFEQVALVFALHDGTDVHFIVRRSDAELIVHREPGEELDAMRGEVGAVTKRGRPDGDPVSQSPRWQRFAAEFGHALEAPLADVHTVVFLLGITLDGFPMHLVKFDGGYLVEHRPCSFVASLLQLVGLRTRADMTPTSSQGVAGIVSVPRAGESAGTMEAFRNGAEDWRLPLEGSYRVEALTGPAATSSAVIDLMSRSTILLLSCHGVADPGGGVHALLVAAHDQLPPSLVRALGSAKGNDFLLSWNSLIGVAPRAVISAACSSASSTVAVSGERIALDRTLLAAGTTLFFGPLWDVSVADGHRFITALLRHRFGGGDVDRPASLSWAQAWVTVVGELAAEMPPATWQAFVPFGDWR